MMNHRAQNDLVRVNKSRKNTKRSIFDQYNDHNLRAIRHQPFQAQQQTQVYIVDKKDFKSVVHQLTGYESSLPQNIPKRQKTNRISPVQDDPDVSLYMTFLKSCLDDESSGSNDDQFQQPLQSQIPTQAPSQPQVGNQPMSYSNDLEHAMSTTYLSPWFSQQVHDAYSFEPPTLQYPQPLSSNLTFCSMNHSGVFGPDLQHP